VAEVAAPISAGRFDATVVIPSRIESVRLCASFLVQAARSLKVPAADDPLFEMAIGEALNNAVKHGPHDCESSIRCEFELAARCLTIRVLGQGEEFQLESAPPVAPWPELTGDNWQAIPESGYGLRIIAAVFPEMRAVSRDDLHGIELKLRF
jgi:anti-sigma regulatory factor (Ser/Thr protein kinase)